MTQWPTFSKSIFCKKYNLFGFAEGRYFAIVFGNGVICYYWAFNLADIAEHNENYQPSKSRLFSMLGSNFTEGLKPSPPPVLCRDQKAQCFRVNRTRDQNKVKSDDLHKQKQENIDKESVKISLAS